MISNPTLRNNVTVSSSVSVRPSFSCCLIRCRIISGLSSIQSGTLAIVIPSSICPPISALLLPIERLSKTLKRFYGVVKSGLSHILTFAFGSDLKRGDREEELEELNSKLPVRDERRKNAEVARQVCISTSGVSKILS